MIIIDNSRKTNIILISTMILCIVTAVSFIIASISIAKIATQSCYETLEDATLNIVSDVKSQIIEERERLEIVSDIYANHDCFTNQDIKSHFSSFNTTGLTDSLILFLPDEGLIQLKGSMGIDIKLDFETEVLKAPYLSNVKYLPDGTRCNYWAVPIEKNGKTVGVLYGIMNLSLYSDEYDVTSYNGQDDMYVIDGSSGKLITNCIGKGNSKELFAVLQDKVEFNTHNKDFILGLSGSMQYYSSAQKERCYAYYKPVGIKNWMVVLSVPESVAFSRADQIRKVMLIMVFFEIICLAIYSSFAIKHLQKAKMKKEKQLEQSRFMLEVQQLLFEAYKNPGQIIIALEKVAKMLTAEKAFLIASDGVIVKDIYCYGNEEGEKEREFYGKNINKLFPNTGPLIKKGKSILYYKPDRTCLFDKVDNKNLDKNSVKNIMIVPVVDGSNRFSGFVGVTNMKIRWEDTSILECVAANFIMALTNIKSFRIIKRMGEVDELTGLQNRNSYQQAVAKYSYQKPNDFCCIYMDANGLHKMNNKYGHKAGDEMLKCIGKSLSCIFSDENCYRIGGDEFVVFCTELDNEVVNQKVYEFAKQMMSHDFHISMGMAWIQNEKTIDKTVLEAERRMYEDKKLYYKNLGDSSEARI